MLHCFIKPVILYRIRDILGIRLQNRIMMPHDHPVSCSFDHIKIIAAVSEGIDLIILQSQFFLYVRNCSCLRIFYLYKSVSYQNHNLYLPLTALFQVPDQPYILYCFPPAPALRYGWSNRYPLFLPESLLPCSLS